MSEKIGDYRVIRPLGQGGMAEVFVVEKIGPAGFQVQLCLKRIRRDYADNIEFVKAFEAEARIISRLKNSNIVNVSDFFHDGHDLCLVMELIDGMDLSNIIKTLKIFPSVKLETGFAIYILKELLQALKTAHQMNVIHRDISPHNLLISTQGAVKLSDFGVAKALGLSEATRTGVIKGKLCYMPPEQLKGGKNPIGPEADLFAAGVVFWEMLANDRLFKATTEQQLIGSVMAFQKAPIPDAPPKVNGFLNKILAPDPADRFHSADEAREALNNIGIDPLHSDNVGELVSKLKDFKEMLAAVAQGAHLKKPSQHTEIAPDKYNTTDDYLREISSSVYATNTEQDTDMRLSRESIGTARESVIKRKRSKVLIVAVAAVFVATILLWVWILVGPEKEAETDIGVNQQETTTKVLEVEHKESPPVEKTTIEKAVKPPEPSVVEGINPEPMPIQTDISKAIPVQTPHKKESKKSKRLTKPKQPKNKDNAPVDKLAPYVPSERE